MKKNFFTKIVTALLIVSMVFSVTGLSFPKKAEAFLGFGDIVFDPTAFGEAVINVANTTATSFSTYSLQFKAFVLDTLATAVAKALIRQITADVVNWINSGFEGSPAFLTNPGSFFLDAADQVTGEFLAKYGGPLTDLCSPFSIDIRLALSFKYHPKTQQKYACTIGAIIKNSKNAVAGASINGFTAGDFRQGGWPAFVSLTTEPQNNIYGAYLMADSELSIRVANAQIAKKDEVSNGKGFLSWRNPDCKKSVEAYNQQVDTNIKQKLNDKFNDPTALNFGEGSQVNYSNPVSSVGGEAAYTRKSVNDCPVETPGSLIVSNLETSVNGPLHELELVDSINEVVNALAAQLVTTVLKGGLKAVTGGGPSDSTSYIYQIQNEANNAAADVSTKENLYASVQRYIVDTLKYKTSKDQSLNLILGAKKSYDDAAACYGTKITSSQPPLTSSQIQQAQDKITAINAAKDSKLTALVTQYTESAKQADNRYDTLIDIKNKTYAAQTTAALNVPAQRFSQLLQSQNITTGKDIADAEEELTATQTLVTPIKQDGDARLQECKLFPTGTSSGQAQSVVLQGSN